MHTDKKDESKYIAFGWILSIGSIGFYTLLYILIGFDCGSLLFGGCTGSQVAAKLIFLPIIFVISYIYYILYGWLKLRMSLYRAAFPVLAIPAILLASTFSTELSSAQQDKKERIAQLRDKYGHVEEAINRVELGTMRFSIKESSSMYDLVYIFPIQIPLMIDRYEPFMHNRGIIGVNYPELKECQFNSSTRCLRNLRSGDQMCEYDDNLSRIDATKSAGLMGNYEFLEFRSIKKEGCSADIMQDYVHKTKYKKRNYEEFIRCEGLRTQVGFQFSDPCD